MAIRGVKLKTTASNAETKNGGDRTPVSYTSL
jgi:hypothetical protein